MFFSKDFVRKETAFDPVKIGDKGFGVKKLQEWLCLSGHKVVIDGSFGPVTERVLEKATGKIELDINSWLDLTKPLWGIEEIVDLMKLGRIQMGVCPKVASVAATIATSFRLRYVREVGGNNRGPWVRLFMRGKEGKSQPWCAGFVSTVLEIAQEVTDTKIPFEYTGSSSQMVRNARSKGVLLSEAGFKSSEEDRVAVFAVKGGNTGYKHVGFAFKTDEPEMFFTVEGNSSLAGVADGDGVVSITRSTKEKVFISL